MARVWVVTAVSESTDNYGPYVFSKKPSDRMLEHFFRGKCPGEWEPDGPGDWGSWLYVTVKRCDTE